jgi:hypothetical protein
MPAPPSYPDDSMRPRCEGTDRFSNQNKRTRKDNDNLGLQHSKPIDLAETIDLAATTMDLDEGSKWNFREVLAVHCSQQINWASAVNGEQLISTLAENICVPGTLGLKQNGKMKSKLGSISFRSTTSRECLYDDKTSPQRSWKPYSKTCA